MNNGHSITCSSGPVYVIWHRGMSFTTPPRRSRAETQIHQALASEGRDKLERRLRRENADRKARNDAESRRRSAPTSGAPPAHRRLQTYDDALAARMQARRTT